MDNTNISHIIKLHKAYKQGRLVVFVGAGVSANSGVPTWESLIDALRDDLPNNFKYEKDDLKVAQIYKDSHGQKNYIEKVRDVLKDGRTSYNPIHQAILDLNPIHIITTNYDDLIEQSIQADCKQYEVISKDSDLPYYRCPNKLVKMHGDFKTGNIVLTEEDYYNYSSCFPLIRSFVTSLFTTNIILFVGFSFNDLNLKIILNELKNVLDKDMQRVYLLSDLSSIDFSTYNYYEQKGIAVVNIPNADELISQYDIAIDGVTTNKINSRRGQNLYKQLKLIRLIEEDYSKETLKIILSRLKSIQTELTVLDDGLKYLMPKNTYKYWSYYSNGLRIESDYFKNLNNTLSTLQGKRAFVSSFPKEERDFLLQQALLNRVCSIDALNIITNKNQERIQKKIDTDVPVFLFYDLKFDELNLAIKTLREQGMFYDKRDLYLPYLLCRLGRFYEAYLIYKNLMPVFWNKGLYVLYFISIYNLYHIRGGIWNEVWNRKDIDVDTIIDDINGFDTETILLKLPLGDVEKNTLNDLLSNKFFVNFTLKANDLSSRIHLQRKKSENGSVSSNNDIFSLISRFWRLFFFCIRNSIEYRNEYFDIIVKDTIIGILNSHKTSKGTIANIFENTRIDILESEHVFIIISFISSKELSDIITQFEINKIKFSDRAIAYLDEMVENLYNSMIGKDNAHNVSFESKYIIHIVGNIILILDRATNDLPSKLSARLYDIILKEWHLIFNDRNVVTALCHLINKYPPEIETLTRILEECVHTPHLSNKFLTFSVAKLLAASGYLYPHTLEDAYLLDDYGWNGFVLYRVLPKNTRVHYVSLLQNSAKDIIEYSNILLYLRVKIKEEYHFKNLLDNVNFTKGTSPEKKWALISNLARLRKDRKFSNIHSIIDGFGEKHKEYQFLMNPTKYKIIEEIEPLWMLSCTRKELKELLKNEVLRKKMKDHITSDVGRQYFDSIYPLL